MYSEWCDFCEKPMKCHNVDGLLVCIGCKSVTGRAPA